MWNLFIYMSQPSKRNCLACIVIFQFSTVNVCCKVLLLSLRNVDHSSTERGSYKTSQNNAENTPLGYYFTSQQEYLQQQKKTDLHVYAHF